MALSIAWSFSSKNLLLQSYILNHACHRAFGTKKIDVADRPKKPMSVFLAYFNSVRKDLKVKYPDKKLTEISPMAAQMYRNLSEVEKKELEERYAKQKEQYNAEMERWLNELTAEQKAEMQMMKEKKKTEKVERNAVKDLNKPKKPPKGFILFYQMKRQALPYEKRSADKLTDVVKELSQVWKNMSREEKKKYDNVAASEQYKNDLLEWEKQMVSKGVLSLVRIRSLRHLIPPTLKPAKKVQKSTKSNEKDSAKNTEKMSGSNSIKSKEKTTPKKTK